MLIIEQTVVLTAASDGLVDFLILQFNGGFRIYFDIIIFDHSVVLFDQSFNLSVGVHVDDDWINDEDLHLHENLFCVLENPDQRNCLHEGVSLVDDRGHVVIFQEFPAFYKKSCSPFEFSIFPLENEFFVNSFGFNHVIEKL